MQIREVPWPPNLLYVLDALEEGTHQEFIVTPVDRGPPKRRPAHSPMPALKGLARVGAQDEDEFLRLINSARGAMVVWEDRSRPSGMAKAVVKKCELRQRNTQQIFAISGEGKKSSPITGHIDYDIILLLR